MNPFRNILHLFYGDFLGKALYFLAFVYLARTLGVEQYGVLEFAMSVLTYFLLVADGGIELWAVRNSIREGDVPTLVGRVLPLRILLAVGTCIALVLLLPIFPDFPGLIPLMLLLGVTLLVQAVNLKWVFMGQERLAWVGIGLAIGQVVFALAVFGFIEHPADLLWIPVFRFIGDGGMAVYFCILYFNQYGKFRMTFSVQGATAILKPALVMGISLGLGLISYNFDSVLLGLLVGPTAVGLYGVAYRPLTVALAMPLTYFQGLFPSLARTYKEGPDAFRALMGRSLGVTSIVAVPFGVGGFFLAEPLIAFLFGDAYRDGVPALQILAWSGLFVVLRGTYKYGFHAAGIPVLDLQCGGVAVGINVVLTIVLIPPFGIIGAAVATVLSDMVWLGMAGYYFKKKVLTIRLLPYLYRPALAATSMGAVFLMAQSFFWVFQGLIAGGMYLTVLFLLGDPELRALKSLICSSGGAGLLKGT